MKKSLPIIIIMIAIFVAFKFKNRQEVANNLQENLISACGQNAECVSNIKAKFESCFNQHYDNGSKVRAGSLDETKFKSCLSASK